MAFALCVLVNVCIAALFKVFPRFRIQALNAIVVNYTICLLLGHLLSGSGPWPFHPDILTAQWFAYDVMLGGLFVSGFTILALVVERAGIALTTMMQKMSLILTVLVTVVLFHVPFGMLQGLGIGLAILAIVAINQRKGSTFIHIGDTNSLLLFMVMVLSAAIEIILFYVQQSGTVGSDLLPFTTYGFGCAAILGWIWIGVRCLQGPYRIHLRDVLAGIVLGLPNFLSIYLLLHMLDHGWNASIMYPLVNVSILLLSTVMAFLLFREKLQARNWMGVGLAVIAILLIGYAQYLNG